jgi:hypothetical protein
VSSDESVALELQELSIESSSSSRGKEGSGGQQMLPELLNKTHTNHELKLPRKA